MEHSSHIEKEQGHGLPDKSVLAAHDFMEHAEHDRELVSLFPSFWTLLVNIAPSLAASGGGESARGGLSADIKTYKGGTGRAV